MCSTSARSSSTTSGSTARRPTTGAIPTSGCARCSATARDVAQHMDELGFDVLWTAEHHFQREGYEVFPNLIQLGLWLATQTKRLKFGCAFNVLPMWHPIRLAEDYAMADIVTDGRVIMGVGRGYHTREVETFGAPLIDAEKNRELLRGAAAAAADLLQRAGVPVQGQVLRVPAGGGVSRLSRSRTSPWCRGRSTCRWRSGCRSPAARPSSMMAQYGLKAMVTLNGEKILDDVVRAYHAACLKHGRQQAARRGHDLGRRRLSRRQPGRGDAPARAGARRALQVVRAVRLRALCRRAGPHLGLARRAGADADAARTASRRRPGSAARRTR